MSKKITPVERAIVAVSGPSGAGGQSKLAELLGISAQAVQQWVDSGMVPPRRVLDVERITGISRFELRPDIYGDPPSELSTETIAASAS